MKAISSSTESLAGFDASTFPAPALPVQPVLTWGTAVGGDGANKMPAICDIPQARFVTSGRVAIATALQLMGVGPDDKVLVPAFHCSSMVEPIVWLQAKFDFYHILQNTKIDLEALHKLNPGSYKVLIVAHYFGFHQDMDEIRAFCDHYGIALLEDCAHAFFGSYKGKPMGSTGDYAIASPMKFFPSYDGGCLASTRHSLADVQLQPASRSMQVKSALNSVENAIDAGELSPLNFILQPLLWCKDQLWGYLKNRQQKTGDAEPMSMAPGSSSGRAEFDPSWMGVAMSSASRRLMLMAPRNRVVERRRSNYQYLFNALSDLKGTHPLHNELPDDTVPQVFPLYVDNASAVFPALKQQGVPIIRFGEFLWDGIDEKTCAVAVDYSKHLMQFPCHQSLHKKQLDWMIRAIRDVVETH